MLQSPDAVRVVPATPPEHPTPKRAARCKWCFGDGERSIAGVLAECPQCGGNGMARPATIPRHETPSTG